MYNTIKTFIKSKDGMRKKNVVEWTHSLSTISFIIIWFLNYLEEDLGISYASSVLGDYQV